MDNFTYEQLYGVTLEEYLSKHNSTVDELIKKTEIDIELLKKNLAKLIDLEVELIQKDIDSTVHMHLITSVYNLIRKKDKHLTKLKEWEGRHGKTKEE